MTLSEKNECALYITKLETECQVPMIKTFRPRYP
jgi:hypothetical protein